MTDPTNRRGTSRRGFMTAAAGGALASSALPAFAEAQPAGAGSADAVTPMAFGAVADGAADCTAAVQRAVDLGLEQGRPIFFPPGLYRITRPILVRSPRTMPDSARFAAGARLFGSGLGHTIFDNQIGDGALFDLDAAAADGAGFRAALGCRLEGFSIRRTIATVRGSGIRLRSAFQARLSDLHIIGMSGDGVVIECQAGDSDGSNMIALDQVRIENCSGWGIAAAAAPGRNEISFLSLRQVFVQNCGVDGPAAEAPASGGMRWKGQVCTIEQCGFTLNRNVALFIPGEAGLAQSLDLRGTAFENNVGRHLLCTGITGLKARNVQFYSGNGTPVAVACELDGRRNTIRSVDIDGVVVRAGADNRDQVAFRVGGPQAELARIRVRNVVWEDFDHPGQTRFDGFLFDDVRLCCALRRLSAREVAFGPDPAAPHGNGAPLRLRGGGGGAPSRSGEWVRIAIVSDLVLPNAGLDPGGAYWVYLYDDNGRPRLAASPVAPVPDRLSGYNVRGDDPAMLAVGQVSIDAAGGFAALG